MIDAIMYDHSVLRYNEFSLLTHIPNMMLLKLDRMYKYM